MSTRRRAALPPAPPPPQYIPPTLQTERPHPEVTRRVRSSTATVQLSGKAEDDKPLPFAFGTVETHGSIRYAFRNGKDLWLVRALALGKRSATAGGAETAGEIDSLLSVKSETGFSPSMTFFYESWFYTGSLAQTVNAQLAAIDASWNETLIVTNPLTGEQRGICYIVERYLNYVDYWQRYHGGLPKWLYRLKGSKLYDPRTGLTAYTENLFLQWRYWATDPDGRNLPLASIDTASFNAAATIGDQVLGTGKRYEAHVLMESGTVDDWLKMFRLLGDAYWYEKDDGKWAVLIDSLQAPVATFTDLHYTSSRQVELGPPSDADAVVNKVTIEYTDTTTAAWRTEPVTLAMPGVAAGTEPEVAATYKMPELHHRAQAETKLRLLLYGAQDDQRLSLNWRPNTGERVLGEVITQVIPERGISGDFRIFSRELLPDGTINVELQQVSPRKYSDSTSATPPKFTSSPPPLSIPAPPMPAAHTLVDAWPPDGSETTLWWEPPANYNESYISHYEVLKGNSTSGWRLWTTVARDARPTATNPLVVTGLTTKNWNTLTFGGGRTVDYDIVAVTINGQRSPTQTNNYAAGMHFVGIISASRATGATHEYVLQGEAALTLANGVNHNVTWTSGPASLYATGMTSDAVITGLVAPTNGGTFMRIFNPPVSPQNVGLTHEDTGSSAVNRIDTVGRGSFVGITPGCTAFLEYSMQYQRWRLLAIFGGSSALWASSATISGEVTISDVVTLNDYATNVLGGGPLVLSTAAQKYGLRIDGSGVLHIDGYNGSWASLVRLASDGSLTVPRVGIGKAPNASYSLDLAEGLRVLSTAYGTTGIEFAALSASTVRILGYDRVANVWKDVLIEQNGTSNTVFAASGKVGIAMVDAPGAALDVGGSSPMIRVVADADTYAQFGLYERVAGTPTLKWNIYNDYSSDRLSFGNAGGARVQIGSTGDVIAQGLIYERGRLYGMGDWIGVTYAAGNFTAPAGGTWTVEAGDMSMYRYSLVGKSMVLQGNLSQTTVTGAGATQLAVAIPGGFSVAGSTDIFVPLLRYDAGTGLWTNDAWARATSGATTVIFQKFDGSSFAGATNGSYFVFQITIPLA